MPSDLYNPDGLDFELAVKTFRECAGTEAVNPLHAFEHIRDCKFCRTKLKLPLSCATEEINIINPKGARQAPKKIGH